MAIGVVLICRYVAVLGGSCCFLAWLLFTSATNALSLSPVVAHLRSRLCFLLRPASLSVFCCRVSSSSRYVSVLLLVFMVRRFWRYCFVSFFNLWVFTITASSECYEDVATFLGDFQPCCLALVLAGRDAVVVVMVM